MSPELKLAAHMDKEDAQDNLEMEIAEVAEVLCCHIEGYTSHTNNHMVNSFQDSDEWADALSKYADRIAREKMEG